MVLLDGLQEQPLPTVHLGSNRMGRQIREATSGLGTLGTPGLGTPGIPTSLQQALSRDDSIEYSDDSPQGENNYQSSTRVSRNKNISK